MYKTSGHLPYYAESMFPPMILDEYAVERLKLKQRLQEIDKVLANYFNQIQKTMRLRSIFSNRMN